MIRRTARLAAILLLAALPAGCRQERWETYTCPLPHGMSYAEARDRLLKLDNLTPPNVSCASGILTVRYNALNLSPGNIGCALNAPADPEK